VTAPLVYEADPEAFLDRQNRLRAHIGLFAESSSLEVVEWTAGLVAIQREVDPLPLVVGVRYRIRLLFVDQSVKHRHAVLEDGAVVGLDVPVLLGGSYQEWEGVFLGRRPMPSGAADLLIFDVAGRAIGLGDVDILRLEEIR
jgi:hypothetical protein